MTIVFTIIAFVIALFLWFIWRALEAIAEILWMMQREIDTRSLIRDPRDP